MTHRKLDRAARAFRIGDRNGKFKIWSGEGAALHDGRWHEKGQEVIYAAEHLSLAMLESLVHFNGILPDGQHFIEITLPAGVTYEAITRDTIEGWHQKDSVSARTFGAQWLKEKRSALLFVPSVVVREERNLLINPAHKDFRLIAVGLELPVHWDSRLFGA